MLILTPTTRVDKNGRTVTRHMRAEKPAPDKKTSIPKVHQKPATNSVAHRLDVQKELLTILYDGENPMEWRKKNEPLLNRLKHVTSSGFLQRALDLASHADSLENGYLRSENLGYIKSQLERGMVNNIDRLHVNLDLIPEICEFSKVATFLRRLPSSVHNEADRLPALPEHLAAHDAFPSLNDFGPQGARLTYGNSESFKVVKDFPDRIDDIIELMKRGIVHTGLRDALTGIDFGPSRPLTDGVL
jgi:hypothetical protein